MININFVAIMTFKTREPLINYVMSLAHRLIRNQGTTLKACVGLVKSCNAGCGSVCEPRRAGSETHIYCVALLTKDLGHLLRSASCICTFQNPQRYNIIDQRFPSVKTLTTREIHI